MSRRELDNNTAAAVLVGITLDVLWAGMQKDDSSTALGLDPSEWRKLADDFGYLNIEDLQTDLFEHAKNYYENF